MSVSGSCWFCHQPTDSRNQYYICPACAHLQSTIDLLKRAGVPSYACVEGCKCGRFFHDFEHEKLFEIICAQCGKEHS